MRYLYQDLLNLRRIAIENRLSDDVELYIEKCYRYYSKTYGLDLESAKSTLTPEQVALVYFEDEMEEWTIDEVLDLRKLLSTSDKPVLESNIKSPHEEQTSDEEWIAEQEALLKKEDEKKAKQQEEIAKKTHQAIEKLTSSFNSFKTAVEQK